MTGVQTCALPIWDESGKVQNPAPYLIYLESNLVVRAIRDYFHDEIGEILVDTEDIYEQAALWHQGQHRDDFDWDGFTRWLAANPEHRACYNEIALLDEEIDRLRPALLPRAVKNKGARKWLRWRIVAGAVAASAVAIVSLPLLRFDAPTASPVYRTAASEMRSVTLPSGAKATLAPGSTLVANVDNARHVRLTGTAFFDVRHDPASPCTVEAADFLVKDVGTRFDVSLENGILRVAVQAGTVSVSTVRFAQPVVLDAGKALFADPGRGVVEITACSTHGVFSGPAIERIEASSLREVVVTDSIPLPPGKSSTKIKRLSSAPLFGEAIRRIHLGESVGALFGKEAAIAEEMVFWDGEHAGLSPSGAVVRSGDVRGRAAQAKLKR